MLNELSNYWNNFVTLHHKMELLTPKPYLIQMVPFTFNNFDQYHESQKISPYNYQHEHWIWSSTCILGKVSQPQVKNVQNTASSDIFLKTYFEAYIDNYHTISEDFIGIYLTYTYNTEGWVWNFGKLTTNAFLKLTGNITSMESSASHIVKLYMKNAYPHTVHRWNSKSWFIKNPVKSF